MYLNKKILVTGIVLLLSTASATFARPINPAPRPISPESELDRYFRIAFDAATAGDFDTAIINYRRAASATEDQCDRQHAEAGIEAATAAKAQKNAGRTSLLTQIFARKLEELALPLPCTTQR
jgi:hypothetical protein